MRASFSRDELLTALRVISQILQAFPGSDFAVDESVTEPPQIVPVETPKPINNNAPISYGYGKGQAQPPRKTYVIAPKIKLDRVDWTDLPRAARRIAELLADAPRPLTSHEVMKQLEIARPTFSNAISKLRGKKVVVAVANHNAAVEQHR